MTEDEAVARLDAMPGGRHGDPEADHSRADDVLLLMVPTRVREAYIRLEKRSRWWGAA